MLQLYFGQSPSVTDFAGVVFTDKLSNLAEKHLRGFFRPPLPVSIPLYSTWRTTGLFLPLFSLYCQSQTRRLFCYCYTSTKLEYIHRVVCT